MWNKLWKAVRWTLSLLFRTGWYLLAVIVSWQLWRNYAAILDAVGLPRVWAMIPVGIVAATMILIHPPKSLTRLFGRIKLPDWLRKTLDVLRWPLWLGGGAIVTAWIWTVYHDALGDNWLEIPGQVKTYAAFVAPAAILITLFFLPSSLPLLAALIAALVCVCRQTPIPLALLPTLVFALSLVMAGRPYLWRAAPRWALGLRRVPRKERHWKYGLDFFSVGFYRKKDGRRFVFFRFLNVCVLAPTVIVTAVFSAAVDRYSGNLPKDLSAVTAYKPAVTTEVRAANGETICSFKMMNREFVDLNRVPERLRQAIRAAEDKNFDRHHGFDAIAILRAVKANRDSGETRQGASTLTQQVAKQILLTPERSYERKIKELLLAVRIERELTKDRIEEIYLTQTYFGRNDYGVQAAAEDYFGKDVADLTLAESAMLAGLPKAPSIDSPDKHFARAKARQRYVLGRMVDLGYISREEMLSALDERIVLLEPRYPLNNGAAAYVCEHVRQYVQSQYGYGLVFENGLIIDTTIDPGMQRHAQAAVQYGLLDLERRLGFEGPEDHDASFNGECSAAAETVADNAVEPDARVVSVEPAVEVCLRGNRFPLDPDDVVRVRKWEKAGGGKRRLAVGDVLTVRVETRVVKKGKLTETVRYALAARRTAGPRSLQAALVAVDPETGFLKAMVGGYDFAKGPFNIATQGRRQIGSSVKPYVYLTALMHGDTVDEKVDDHRVCYETATGLWCPENYKGVNTKRQYYGPVSLSTAIALSLNSVSVQLLAKAGVDAVIRTMRSLGIVSEIKPVMPIAVGAVEITPWEHTYGYASIAANGRAMPSQPGTGLPGIFITRVTEKGNPVPLYEYRPEPPKQAVPAADAYALIYLMKGVVQFGTGRRVQELRRPAAGKTGTTNDFRDAWFMGFTADLVVGVWVGRQTPWPIAPEAAEAAGGKVALPIWLGFMKAAHPDTPPREFPVPADVVLMLDADGKPVPYQRGRVPETLLGRNDPEASLSGP